MSKQQTRTKVVRFRVTQAEYDALKRAAKGQPAIERRGPRNHVSDWCRATLLAAAANQSNQR